MSIKFLIVLCTIFFFSPSTVLAIVKQKGVVVSASVDLNRVTIYGYTSPNSKVELSSTRVFATTYSNDLGYYIFEKSILPKNPSELCITSINGSSVRTVPTCIPPPPPANYHTDIGPIFLPPTVALDTSKVSPNSTTTINGYTIPLSTVDIFFFQTSSKSIIFPQPVNAFSLPKISTTAKPDGSYSLSLPTSYSSNYRVYTTSNYQEYSTPKSNTLLYKLPSIWYLLLIQYRYAIFTSLILLIITIICIILIYSKTNGPKARTTLSKD